LFFPILSIAQQKIIQLYDNTPKGSELWNWGEKQTNVNVARSLVFNVTSPTLTLFTPEPKKSNGTAIIVVPGGGFLFLDMENEGYDVANSLVEKGFTVFILKYRVCHINNDDPMGTLMNNYRDGKWENLIKTTIPLSVADGRASIEYVRSHAAEFMINKDKIGIIGFSAGGTVAASTAFDYQKNNRPAFVASIYPYFPESMHKEILPDAPPLFLSAATNDQGGFHFHCTSLYKLWAEQNKQVELHLYATGGHGFGMKKQGFSSDTWIQRFYEFMKQQGFISNL
jgi:acetyl esterase/lipase